MKAIILAAGQGSRFGKYTKGRPKCLLEIDGVSILERQINCFRRFGIEDIIIVKNSRPEAKYISFDNVHYYINSAFDVNMVYSLFCAEPEIQQDVIISYADVLFDDSVLSALLRSNYDISVIVDSLWEEYYKERFEDPLSDAESLILSPDNRILEIGSKFPTLEDIHAQYIGLIKLSSKGSEIFKSTYAIGREQYWDKVWIRGRVFQKIYMTDFLQILVNNDVPVYAISVEHGWLEFDTVKDYEMVLNWHSKGTLNKFCSIR